jgi:Ca2+-binding EF-hand superfamily protein
MTMRFAMTALLLAGATLMLASVTRGESPGKPYDPRASFAQTDTNKDGVIDIEEFHVRMVEVFYNADTNKEGFLSVDEYGRMPFSGAFKDADANGDGRISLPEFVTIRFRQFEEADTNHDTQLSVDEVITAYEGIKQQ